MADVNHVILIGRLTRDAELKYTSAGAAVCKFAIAVNRRVKQGEQWAEEASFFDVVLWGRSGESLNQYLVKGKQVAVEGELHQNRWEKDGQTQSKVEIIADNVQLLGGNTGATSSQPSAPAAGYQKRAPNATATPPHASRDDSTPPDFPDNSDIPF
jgi:single-strand DNA-binding protein